MNPILLVFFISSVAAHVSLRYNPRYPVSGRFRSRHYAADEAQKAAQDIMAVFTKAHATKDKALYLSLFDKSFTMTACGITMTYSELEKSAVSGTPIKEGDIIDITNAVINGDELKFTLSDKNFKESQKMHMVAKKFGEGFKFIKWEMEGMPCSPNGSSKKLRHADQAHEAAQSILDVLQKADATNNVALFLSAFDKSFTLSACGHTMTYNDLVKAGTNGDPVKSGAKLQIISAVLTGDELNFSVVEHFGKLDEKLHLVAKKIGGEGFKLVKAEIEGIPCSPNGSKKLRHGESSSSSSEEDTF